MTWHNAGHARRVSAEAKDKAWMTRALVPVLWIALLAGCSLARHSQSPGQQAPPAPADAATPNPPGETDEQRHRLEGFRSHLRRSYPALKLESKDELWATGVEYIKWLGLDIDSQPGTARLEETLSKLVAEDAHESRWLFKGTVQTNATAALPAKDVFYGVATLAQAGDDVTFSCHTAEADLKFFGRLKDGRLRGDLVFSAASINFSGKAQGTLATGRIVLDGQGQSAKRRLNCAFVFLR